MPGLATESRGPVTIMRLSQGKANAMDVGLLRELEAAFARETKSAARAVILAADGPMFSAGLDLKQLADGGPAYIRNLLPALHDALRAAFTFPKPLVAAINGHALAGGCVFAATADARVMARGSFKIGVTEILVGMPFPPAALGMMRHVCSPSALQEVALTGRVWGPDEALTRGLVDEVVELPALFNRALELASAFAAVPARAFALTKQQLRSMTLEKIDRDQKELGAQILEAWCAPEVGAAVQKYVEKTLGRGKTSG